MVRQPDSSPKTPFKKEMGEVKELCEYHYASDFLLLIGDKRFCREVVDKVPAFAFICFQEAQKRRLLLAPFARNIGQEFIRNKNSSFYHEISGHDSGYVGYVQPVAKIIFGNYQYVEQCAQSHDSPLDPGYPGQFDGEQMEAYSRASLAFLESYLKETSGKSRSQALNSVFRTFEYSLSGVYEIESAADYRKVPAYGRLEATISFVTSAIRLLETHATLPKNFRVSTIPNEDIFDKIAQLIFNAIFAVSTISSSIDSDVAWIIRHNTVWSPLFGINESRTGKIIALKVRRLIYSEIMEMNRFANFKGARLLGYCLDILGLQPIDRHRGFRKDFYPLQSAALSWVKSNYKNLLVNHPEVATACLQGSITYDAKKHRLVKTYRQGTYKEAPRETFELDG